MKNLVSLLVLLVFSFRLEAQSLNCTFKEPVVTINFGTGFVQDANVTSLLHYERVRSSCPTDGHYSYVPFTSDCFRGDWFTLTDDHTAGDESGNMLLVNSAYSTGTFFKTIINGLKGGTTYQFGVWLMNVCRITDKCPFPLLPNITIQLQTRSGKTVAQFVTGEVIRHPVPHWTQHRAIFTTPTSETSLTLVMTNNKPGGCGNDFALDDITFRECIISKTPQTKTTIVAKKPVTPVKKVAKKQAPSPEKKQARKVEVPKPQKDSQVFTVPVIKPKPREFPPPPPVLRRRENTVVKKIEAEPGEIRVNLYDNGEIDGDTISVYHNNVLIMAHARLSQKPLSISIAIDPSQPHHELVMVAENLGSIPPNTSLMIITAAGKRYEVFISSNEQRNAKVVFDLKE